MAQVNQYTLSHKELAEAIIKELGIHEGRWSVIVNFNFRGANVGFEEGVAYPTGLVSISTVGITRADHSTPANLVVDAAEVNPVPSDGSS